MFQLYKLNDDLYCYVSKFSMYEGTTTQIIAYMLTMGVLEHDIRLGLSELDNKGHDVADYGIYRSFIYSKKIA